MTKTDGNSFIFPPPSNRVIKFSIPSSYTEIDIYCSSNKNLFTLICFRVLLKGMYSPLYYNGAVYEMRTGFYLFYGLCLSTYCTLMGIFNFSLGSLHFNFSLGSLHFNFSLGSLHFIFSLGSLHFNAKTENRILQLFFKTTTKLEAARCA